MKKNMVGLREIPMKMRPRTRHRRTAGAPVSEAGNTIISALRPGTKKHETAEGRSLDGLIGCRYSR